jgi:hypothetical protein
MGGAGEEIRLGEGPLTVRVIEGDPRRLSFAGQEVLRRLSYPVRDADWGTHPLRTLEEAATATTYRRRFEAVSGDFAGDFALSLSCPGPDSGLATAELRLTVLRDMVVNRAGFTLLHPLAGVAGTGLRVTRPDGSVADTVFPALIGPGQPARDIAGLAHRVGPVAVDITFSGEVFEMEDQRNWSDASFKTYCRPLAKPRPFALAAGDVVVQTVTIAMTRGAGAAPDPAAAAPVRGRMPEVLVAHEEGVTEAGATEGAVLARIGGQTPADRLARLRPRALEILFDDLDDLARILGRCAAAGLRPARVAALPAAYLQSHQPEGPWPEGATPADAIAPLRRTFPEALVGAGSFTTFTEFNRCRPDPSQVDFVTFGSSAIVHAADDLSVMETLEALPQIFATARAVAPGRPLHLGLMSIGMRSNPYGARVMPNPDGLRLPMAQDDPRQRTGFAAAWAVGVLAAAVEGGVASLVLAMVSGPLGAHGTPLGRVIAAAAAMAGQEVTVERDGGLVRISGPTGGMAGNCGETVAALAGHGTRLCADGRIEAGAGGPLAAGEALLWGRAA